MGIQAKQIVKMAERLGIEMGFGYDRCLTAVLARNLGEHQAPSSSEKESRADLAAQYNLSLRDWNALECGYENYPSGFATESFFGVKNVERNRYYKVGRRVSQMVGYHK